MNIKQNVTPEGNSDFRILVELRQRRGEEDVAINPSEIAEKSVEAIDNAMKTIHGMARKVIGTFKDINVIERPSDVEIEFGIKLTSDANAFVVSAGLESQITVKLCWKKES